MGLDLFFGEKVIKAQNWKTEKLVIEYKVDIISLTEPNKDWRKADQDSTI